MMTQTDSLKFGVEYPADSGQMHYDFELRLPMIADNIAVLQHVGTVSNMQVRTAIFARCLVRLGTIPTETLTSDFLAGNMVDDDFDVLAAAETELKKKRMRSNPPSPSTDSPSSSLVDTASPSPASGS
ncbi:hypothetical protein [Paludibacterium yongneupense]|uniref:hypothetical protein n=1 Tax=Paludibacterium yongneupense TaxID=400061 RepID=UPI00056CA900|nr:hypothetical protein [Paludibacterium yongneupense]